jgi:hypothetical protein
MHAYLRCVVMDGDAVTSLQRFQSSRVAILSSDYESQMLEAESLDLDLKPWRDWPGPPRQSSSHLAVLRKGVSRTDSPVLKAGMVLRTASPIYPA